jgi:DNA replication protein DnaC
MLVIEDLDFASFEDDKSAQAFFSIIDGRYQRKTTIVTSNDSPVKWASKLPNSKMGAALLGRLIEYAVLINMNGAEDKRLKHAKQLLGIASDNNG